MTNQHDETAVLDEFLTKLQLDADLHHALVLRRERLRYMMDNGDAEEVDIEEFCALEKHLDGLLAL